MEQNNREEIEIDLKQIFFVLLDKLFVILACGIFVGVLAFAYTKLFISPTYQSVTTTCVVKNEDDSDVDANDFVTGNYLSKNYVAIVQSNTVFEEVINTLELDMTIAQLKNKVSVINIADTQIIQITVSDTDPYRAQEIADAIRIASEKAIIKILHVPGVEKVDGANLPTAPSSPNMVKNVLLGVIVGVFLSVAVIVIRFILDDTIKSPEDIERYLGISTLASIPMMEEAEYDGERRTTGKGKNKKKNVGKPKREAVR